MYSVIIQNKKTMDSFIEYQALFDAGTNDDKIGICEWNESGDTIDTAVPDLKKLTDDKPEWRAIILRYIDDSEMSLYDSKIENPYEFDICKDFSDSSEEIPVPIIRLTQILGGIPPLEVSFKPTVVKEEHGAPKVVYEHALDAEKEKRHELLSQKYKYQGKRPSSIIIISVRKKGDGQDSLSNSWIMHRESESSEFWKRNYYPSLCRFLVYDFLDQGETQKNKDEFFFWLSVMHVCNNVFDSDVLQAYKLYNLSLDVDKINMENSFQKIANRLRYLKTTFETDVKTNLIKAITEEKRLPDYKIDIPLKIKIPNKKRCRFNLKTFGLLSESNEDDIAIWEKKCLKIEDSLKQSVITAERNLDQASEKVRIHCKYQEGEVLAINQYQEEDLKNETDDLYIDFIRMQGELPSKDLLQKEDVKKSTQNVHKYLAKRVKDKSFFTAITVAFVLLILAMLPAMLNLTDNGSHLLVTAIFLAASLVCMGLFGLLILLFQKHKLNVLIKQYNKLITQAVNILVSNADSYRKYLCMIASHLKGTSFLNIYSKKKYSLESEYDRKNKYILVVNDYLIKIKRWCKASNLNVDFDSDFTASVTEEVIFDELSNAKMMKPDLDENYRADINHSGIKIDTPFPFVKAINIIREELYDG